MEIHKKGRRRDSKPTSSSILLDDDFASGFEDGKFEKFKTLFKVFATLVILGGIGYGAYAYLGNKTENATRTADISQPSSSEMSQLEQCVDEAWNNHKTPEESDPDLYPKLIAGYDAQLACYDTYPDENSATNRLSIESARKSAIDSSKESPSAAVSVDNPSSETRSNSSSNNMTQPSSSGSYDPSKCERYNDESKMWRTEADKTYAIIQRATDSGSGVSDSVMDAWKDQLDKGNKAYEKFQQCRANL